MSNDATLTGELPELSFEELAAFEEFPPYETVVDEAMVATYLHATGDEYRYGDRIPPGLAPMLARLSYLQHHCMPPGGVMRGQSVCWHAAGTLGEPISVRARVVRREQSGERRHVVFECVGTQGGARLFSVGLDLLWPAPRSAT